MIIEKVTGGPFMSNAFVVGCPETKKGVVFDTGIDGAGIPEAAERAGLTIEQILLTHGHVDHVGGVAALKRKWPGVPVRIHPKDEPVAAHAPEIGKMFGVSVEAVTGLQADLAAGDTIAVGTLDFEILFVPGHSPGHVAFVSEGRVFSGDVLFQGSIGRTDLPGGHHATLIRSIKEQLLPLDDETIVYCGHGPETTIGRERRHNPFLR